MALIYTIAAIRAEQPTATVVLTITLFLTPPGVLAAYAGAVNKTLDEIVSALNPEPKQDAYEKRLLKK